MGVKYSKHSCLCFNCIHFPFIVDTGHRIFNYCWLQPKGIEEVVRFQPCLWNDISSSLFCIFNVTKRSPVFHNMDKYKQCIKTILYLSRVTGIVQNSILTLPLEKMEEVVQFKGGSIHCQTMGANGLIFFFNFQYCISMSSKQSRKGLVLHITHMKWISEKLVYKEFMVFKMLSTSVHMAEKHIKYIYRLSKASFMKTIQPSYISITFYINCTQLSYYKSSISPVNRDKWW